MKPSEIRERHARQVEQNATKKSARTLNTARLEAKTRLSRIKGAGLEGVFKSVSEQLGSMRNSAEYPRLFKTLAREALAGTEGGAVVHVDPADADLARQALAEMGVSVEIVSDLKSTGGLVVETDEGRVVRRNTFEDRLERARVALQADAAKALLP